MLDARPVVLLIEADVQEFIEREARCYAPGLAGDFESLGLDGEEDEVEIRFDLCRHLFVWR